MFQHLMTGSPMLKSNSLSFLLIFCQFFANFLSIQIPFNNPEIETFKTNFLIQLRLFFFLCFWQAFEGKWNITFIGNLINSTEMSDKIVIRPNIDSNPKFSFGFCYNSLLNIRNSFAQSDHIKWRLTVDCS
jgi:hypothetical protein